MVLQLIRSKADVDHKDASLGETPLGVAAQNGHFAVTEALLAANAKVDGTHGTSRTALSLASEKGFLSVVSLLVDAKANLHAQTPPLRPVMTVISADGSRVIPEHEWTLMQGKLNENEANGNGANGHGANGHGANGNGANGAQPLTPVFYASLHGHTATVARLLDAKADPRHVDRSGNPPPVFRLSTFSVDEVGATADPELCAAAQKQERNLDVTFPAHSLSEAAISGNGQAVLELLQANAQVNARDTRGRSPLFCAAVHGHADIVEQLIEAKADVDAVAQGHGHGQRGLTPLTGAAAFGHTCVVQRLADAKARVDRADRWGRLPLIEAVRGGHAATAQVLIDAKANVNQMAENDDTALLSAEAYGKAEVVQLLLNAGGNPDRSR